jgi:hypothetical protein
VTGPDKPLWNGVAVLSLVLAVIGIVTRPFLFEPIAAILMLLASKQTANQRLTRPGIVFVMLSAIAGAAIAASYSHALY